MTESYFVFHSPFFHSFIIHLENNYQICLLVGFYSKSKCKSQSSIVEPNLPCPQSLLLDSSWVREEVWEGEGKAPFPSTPRSCFVLVPIPLAPRSRFALVPIPLAPRSRFALVPGEGRRTDCSHCFVACFMAFTSESRVLIPFKWLNVDTPSRLWYGNSLVHSLGYHFYCQTNVVSTWTEIIWNLTRPILP